MKTAYSLIGNVTFFPFCPFNQNAVFLNTINSIFLLLPKSSQLGYSTGPVIYSNRHLGRVSMSFFLPGFPLTCDPWSGCIRGRFRWWLRSGSRWRRPSVWGTQLCLGEALHHHAVLGVAVFAAALLLPTVLSHHIVVAAVVAEDAPAKPRNVKCKGAHFLFQTTFLMPCVLSADTVCRLKIKPGGYRNWREQQVQGPPAVMSAQPPGELALAAEALRGLLID